MTTHPIEFIGGPLDGHTHSFNHSADRLPAIARLAISPDVVRVLTGEQKKISEHVTSAAVYALSHDEQRLRYLHLASITAEDHQLKSA